jgi:hypothetical protein
MNIHELKRYRRSTYETDSLCLGSLDQCQTALKKQLTKLGHGVRGIKTFGTITLIVTDKDKFLIEKVAA